MTIRELKEELERLSCILPDFDDYEINMIGYDIYGERKYSIQVADFTANSDKKIFKLWDR